jgi:phage shock protein A
LILSAAKSRGCAPKSTDSAVKSDSCKGRGISTASAESLLERMLNKIDELCAERDKLKKDQPGPTRIDQSAPQHGRGSRGRGDTALKSAVSKIFLWKS